MIKFDQIVSRILGVVIIVPTIQLFNFIYNRQKFIIVIIMNKDSYYFLNKEYMQWHNKIIYHKIKYNI